MQNILVPKYNIWFIILAIFISNQAFVAHIPSPNEVSKLIQSCNYEKIKEQFEDYEIKINEMFDSITSKANQPQKSAEEKKAKLKSIWSRRDSYGFTPLHWAILLLSKMDKAKEILEFLLSRVDQNINFPEYHNNKQGLLINLLIPELAEQQSPLKIQIQLISNETILNVLLKEKVSLDIFRLFLVGVNPLHLSVPRGSILPSLHCAIWDFQFDFAKELIQARANVNQIASFDISKILIEVGANVGLRSFEATPLHILASAPARPHYSRHGLSSVIREAFSDDGFDVIPNMTKNQKELINILIENGADPRIKAMKKDVIELFKLLSDKRLVLYVMETAKAKSPIEDIKSWANDYLLEQEKLKQNAEAELQKWVIQIEKAKSKQEAKLIRKKNKQPIALQGKSKKPSKDGRNKKNDTNHPILPMPTIGLTTTNDEESGWEVIKKRSYNKKEANRIKDNDIVFININLAEEPIEPITVKISNLFRKHITKRQEEVGGHDVYEEEAIEIMSNPTVILRKEEGNEFRYVFFAPTEGKEFARVVVSKRPNEENFNLITAYRSNVLPKNFNLFNNELNAEFAQ